MDKKKQKGRWQKIHDFLLDSEKINAELSWMQRLWYVIILLASTIYVICNFCEIVSFTFFSQFNGKNLIFLIWIILLVFPLVDNFEGFGIKYKRDRQRISKELNETTDQLMLQSKKSQNTEVNTGQIEKDLENAIERKEDENEQ